MAASGTGDSSPARRHQRFFQFRLITLLVMMGAVSIGCGVTFVFPDAVVVPFTVGVALAIPAVLTVGVVYGRDSLREFCIGALFPMGLLLLLTAIHLFEVLTSAYMLPDLNSANGWEAFFQAFSLRFSSHYRAAAGMACVLSMVIGVLCVAARSAIELKDGGSGD